MTITVLQWKYVSSALYVIAHESGTPLPYGTVPEFFAGEPFDEMRWEDTDFNPPYGSTEEEPDPEAMEKPSWQDIVRVERRRRVSDSAIQLESNSAIGSVEYNFSRVAASLLQEFPMNGAPLHLGGNDGHLALLSTIVNDSAAAGREFPGIALREEGTAVLHDIPCVSDAMDFLYGAVNKRASIVSAQNRARIEAERLGSILYDENGGLDASASENDKLDSREAALSDLESLIGYNNLSDRLQLEMDRADTQAVPADLPTLKVWYCERLEAVATGRQKYLKDALSQQAIDNWATCPEQDAALTEVSKQNTLAAIEIQRSQTAQEAEAAYDAGILSIAGVVSEHSPVWSINGGAETSDASVTVQSRTVEIAAQHPGGASVDGNCAIISSSVEGTDGTAASIVGIVANDGTAQKITYVVPDEIDLPLVVKVEARNLCGPSSIEVTLTE